MSSLKLLRKVRLKNWKDRTLCRSFRIRSMFYRLRKVFQFQQLRRREFVKINLRAWRQGLDNSPVGYLSLQILHINQLDKTMTLNGLQDIQTHLSGLAKRRSPVLWYQLRKQDQDLNQVNFGKTEKALNSFNVINIIIIL